MKKVRLWKDSLVAVIFLLVAAVMYYESSRIYTDDGFAMNPASYPILIITVIVLLSLILLASGIRQGLRKGPAVQAETDETAASEEAAPNYKNPIKMILLLIAYGFGLGYLGFIVSTLAMIIVGTLMLGYRSYTRMAVGAILVTLIIYFGFSRILEVRFPSGLLF